MPIYFRGHRFRVLTAAVPSVSRKADAGLITPSEFVSMVLPQRDAATLFSLAPTLDDLRELAELIYADQAERSEVAA